MVVGLAITYVISAKYVATTKVIVRPQETTGPALALRTKEMDVTYAQFFKSQAAAEKAVDLLKLDAEEDTKPGLLPQLKRAVSDLFVKARSFLLYGQYVEGDRRSQAIGQVQKSVSATVVRDSYVIQVDVAARTGTLAANIANAMATVFVDYARDKETAEASTYRRFMEQRVRVAEETLKRAQAALQQYKSQQEISALDEETKQKIAALVQAETALNDAKSRVKEAEAKLSRAKVQLTNVSQFISSTTTTASTARDVGSQAQTSVGTEESTTRSSEETTRRTGRVTAEQSTDLRTEQEGKSTSETLSPNPVHQRLRENMHLFQQELDALGVREAELAATIERLKGELASSPEKEARLIELTVRATAAQNTYLKQRAEYEDAVLAEAKQINQIRVLERATPPLYPKSPIKLLYLAIPGLVALLAGTGLAFLLEYLDTSIRTLEQAELVLGLPVLSTVPAAPQGPKRRR